jgi:arylsulfatase A-like enzyme
VVILVLDGVSRAELPPWNGSPPATLPALGELSEASAVFDRHRASTTVVAASMASLLSGLPPTAHGMSDPGARLPASLPTVATLARDAGVRTGMFTGVPYTFRAFGFAAGWERFVEHPPQSGAPATAPIDDATAWITDLAKGPADTRAFILVHARGGHPPWDVTPKELAAAPPAEYGGLVEPRKAPQTLARMRRSRRARIVTDADRQRIHALTALGLAGQDRALAALVTALKAAGLWEATLFIVTGDVGSGADDLFADGLDLKEPALSLPLYAHFPGNLAAGRRIGEPTEVVDLARTALSALGLAPVRPTSPPAGGAPEPPRDKGALAHPFGKDLARLVADLDVTADLPQVAVLDSRYSARWGDLVLSGKFPAPPSLCDLGLDATCAFNRRDAMPIAAGAIFRSLVAQDLALRALAEKREPASIDPDTMAAMRVWGAMD